MKDAIRARLRVDIEELLEDPYPGIRIFTRSVDATELCLVFTLSKGPWQGLNLHFKVSFPRTWPVNPPQIVGIRHLEHPLLDDLSAIPCHNLRVHPEHLRSGYRWRWSIPLRVLLIQLLKLFSDYQVIHPQRWIHRPKTTVLDEPTRKYYIREDGLREGRKPDSSSQDVLHREWQAIPGLVLKLKHSTTDGGLFQSQIKGRSLTSDPQRIHLVEESSDSWMEAYYRISAFQCPSCPYGSDDLPHSIHDPHSPAAVDSGRYAEVVEGGMSICHLEVLDDDVLGMIAPYLPPGPLLRFMDVYPRMRWIVSRMKLIPRRELACNFLRRPLREVILGIGIRIKWLAHTLLESDFRWFSKEAFEDYPNKSLHFLPLAFNPDHFERAEESIWSSINTIEDDIIKSYRKWFELDPRRKERRWMEWARKKLDTTQTAEIQFRPGRSVYILFWVMEGITESLFNACDKSIKNATARHRTNPFNKFILRDASQVDKAIISYSLLFHLLLCLYRSDSDLLRQAIHCVQMFRDEPASRTNDAFPDHGFPCGFLITTMIVNILAPIVAPNDHIQLSSIMDPFLEEVIIRDTKSLRQRAPALMEMETGESLFRNKVTFRNSKFNFRKIMFNTLFLRTFGRFYDGEAGLFRLDNDFGFLEDEAIDVLVQGVKEVHQVNSWPRFFHVVDYAKGEALSGVALSDMLRSAVKASLERGYHTPGAQNVTLNMPGT